LTVPARHAIQRRLEKYLFNPTVKYALRIGIAPNAFALLQTTGRNSGKPRFTAVGSGLDGDEFWLVSECGKRSDYIRNLIAQPAVRIKVGRQWLNGIATVIGDDDPVARRRRIDVANGLIGRADGIIFRAAANDPVTIRIHLR
jgi:deazaflavin-dependent oxidoreductase (nitroreductase family)